MAPHCCRICTEHTARCSCLPLSCPMFGSVRRNCHTLLLVACHISSGFSAVTIVNHFVSELMVDEPKVFERKHNAQCVEMLLRQKISSSSSIMRLLKYCLVRFQSCRRDANVPKTFRHLSFNRGRNENWVAFRQGWVLPGDLELRESTGIFSQYSEAAAFTYYRRKRSERAPFCERHDAPSSFSLYRKSRGNMANTSGHSCFENLVRRCLIYRVERNIGVGERGCVGRTTYRWRHVVNI